MAVFNTFTKNKMKKIVLFLIASFVLYACSSNNNEANSNGDNFNRTALLTNWADNIIIPSYLNYQTKVQNLQTNVSVFTSSPSEFNLQTMRQSWVEAYKAYQNVTLFYFGKAMEINLKEATNIYPTDVAGIETNIESANYNLNLLSQFNKQGFPALDYLINGLGTTDSDIVNFYTVHANNVKYKQYLTDVTAKLYSNVTLVIEDWNNGYRDIYVANNGNAVSSSVNITTNLFVKNFEKDIRAGKLGIPGGVFSNGTKFPEKVEAYYKKDISKILLNTSIQAEQNFFMGKHFNSTTTGESLKSYLDYLNVVRNGENLSTIINNQFAVIYSTNNNLNDNLAQQVTSDNSKILDSYDALQQNVIYMKLDMMQALNITIDYVDGDGD